MLSKVDFRQTEKPNDAQGIHSARMIK